jgi:hypothetical protein
MFHRREAKGAEKGRFAQDSRRGLKMAMQVNLPVDFLSLALSSRDFFHGSPRFAWFLSELRVNTSSILIIMLRLDPSDWTCAQNGPAEEASAQALEQREGEAGKPSSLGWSLQPPAGVLSGAFSRCPLRLCGRDPENPANPV